MWIPPPHWSLALVPLPGLSQTPPQCGESFDGAFLGGGLAQTQAGGGGFHSECGVGLSFLRPPPLPKWCPWLALPGLPLGAWMLFALPGQGLGFSGGVLGGGLLDGEQPHCQSPEMAPLAVLPLQCVQHHESCKVSWALYVYL